MRIVYIAAAVVAVAVPVLVVVVRRRQGAAVVGGSTVIGAPPPLPVATAPGLLGVGLTAPVDDKARAGVAFVPPQPPSASPGVPLDDILKKVGLADAAGTVKAGLQFADAQAQLLNAVGGSKAAQDAARVFGPAATLGVLTQLGAAELGKKVGLSEGQVKDVSQVAGLAVPTALVFGAPAVVGLALGKGAAELGSAAIGAILGEDAERSVRNAVSQLDPLREGSLANTVVSGISSIFGGGKKEVVVTTVAEEWASAPELILPHNYSDANWNQGVLRGGAGIMLETNPAFIRAGDRLYLGPSKPGGYGEWRTVTRAYGSALPGTVEVFLEGAALNPMTQGWPNYVKLPPRGEGAITLGPAITAPVTQPLPSPATNSEETSGVTAKLERSGGLFNRSTNLFK